MGLKPALYQPGDNTSGHGPYAPVGYLPGAGQSPNVFIDGKPVHKVGDQTFPHFANIIPPDIHTDTIATGIPTVLVNGTPIAIAGQSLLLCPFGDAGVVGGISATTVTVGGSLTLLA